MSHSTALQSDLETLRPVYEKAKARIDGTDRDWEIRKERLLKEVFEAIKRFKVDDPATKAVFIVGSIQSKILELDAPRLLVAEYETKRTRYAEMAIREGKPAVQF